MSSSSGSSSIDMARVASVEGIVTNPDGSVVCAMGERIVQRETAATSTLPNDMRRYDHRPARPQPRILEKWEISMLVMLGGLCWAVVFIGGYKEWLNDGVKSCESFRCAHACDAEDGACDECLPGFINGGGACYDTVADLPPVKTAAGMGGGFYFTLIITAQVLGASIELVLIYRLQRLRLLRRTEIFILFTALAIELMRMATVDMFMLKGYFSGREYSIFPVPETLNGTNVTTTGALLDNASGMTDVGSGSGGSAVARESGLLYFIATSAAAWDPDECTAFPDDGAVLDYDVHAHRPPGTSGASGHPRFLHLGWVLGGEFCLYYFGATVINEVADNFFVVPTATVSSGKYFKALSIVLELFQLGALFPAAAFSHGECIRYMDPLGTDMYVIRATIVGFGYVFWSSVVVVGLLSAAMLFVHAFIAGMLRASLACRSRRVQALLRPCHSLHACIFRTDDDDDGSPCCRIFQLYLGLLMVPMFFAGSFLGVLVIFGQGSKEGGRAVQTAVLLLLDVLFKIGATLCNECVSYGRAARRRGRARRADLDANARSGDDAPSIDMANMANA